MGIGGIFSALWRRKWIILVAVITPLVVVGLGMSRVQSIYSATARVRIAVAQNGVASYSEYVYADRLLNTYVNYANSLPVRSQVAQKLGLADPAKQVASGQANNAPEVVYQVAIIQSTELLEITAENADPAMAARIANEVAQILVANSDKVFTGAGITALDLISQEVNRVDAELRQARMDYQNLVMQTAQKPSVPEVDLAIKNIERKQKIYDNLVTQYEQARIDQMYRANAATIENAALPPTSPSRPNKLLNLALAGVAGLLGGIGLAFLFENLDTRLYSSKDIEAATQACLLGGVPNVPKNQLFTPGNSSTPLREAFSQVRTHLMLNGRTYTGLKTILLTSPRAREGKSMATANLAFALAQSGKNVVIVDANLRLPRMHKIFGLPNDFGLSNYLMGDMGAFDPPEAVELPMAIDLPEMRNLPEAMNQPTALAQPAAITQPAAIAQPAVHQPATVHRQAAAHRPAMINQPAVQPTQTRGVSLLTSGPIPPNPSDLISSPKMGELIRTLSDQYDVVLIDSASLLAVADAAVLTPYVEEVILVVSRKMARENTVKAAMKQLSDVGAKAVHVIVNFAEPNHEYQYYPKYR